jgi:hypothetical protein
MYGRWVINGRSNGQPTFAIWAPKGKAKPCGFTIEVGRRYEGRFHRHRQLGAPMARNLLKASRRITVYNRTRDKAEILEATGCDRGSFALSANGLVPHPPPQQGTL